ncbi:MAG: hypothetical protein ACR2JB_15910 [Bryobacteraceae bacterium]
MKAKILMIPMAVLVCAAPVLAIFGLGDVVFDPSNFEEALQQLAQLEQQYAQLVETYHVIENQYQQMVRMAQVDPVNMVARYRAIATPWTRSSAANTYSNTLGWIAGINTGQSVQRGYSAATEPLGNYGDALSGVPSDEAQRIKRSYAAVELADGVNLSGMQTIGDLRQNAAAVNTAIQNLENDSLSSDPAMNTEIAVLNKISAASLIDLKNTQDTNKLLVALAEQRIIQTKQERDAETRAINDHIQFLSQAKDAMAAQAQDASAAMLAWRMP